MASFLSKFARGASAAGGKLYMDSYMEEQRAEIMAKRDGVLQKNRMAVQRQDQEFRSSEAAKAREATKSSPQAQLANIKLADAQNLDSLKKEYTNAKSDEEKKAIVEKAMISLGQPFTEKLKTNVKLTADERIVNAQVKAGVYKTKKEAWEALKNNTKDLSVPMFNALVEANEMKFGEEKLSIEQIYDQVQLLTGPKEELAEPPTKELPSDADQKTGTVKISTQEEYDNLPSGAYFMDTFDNIRRRKP